MKEINDMKKKIERQQKILNFLYDLLIGFIIFIIIFGMGFTYGWFLR